MHVPRTDASSRPVESSTWISGNSGVLTPVWLTTRRMPLAMMDPGLGLPGLETFTAEVCNQIHPNAADSPAATGLIEPSPYGPANEATNTKCLRIGKSLRCGQASCGYNLLAALASIAALITILYACFRVYNRAKGRRTQRRRLSDTDTDDSDSDRLIVSLCENSSDEDELEAPESPTETYAPASKRPRMDRAQELGHTTGRPQQQQTAIRVSVIKFQPKSQGQSEPQPSSPPHTSATASLSAPVQTGMHQQAVGGPWGLALEQEAALGHGEGARQQAIGQREASIAVESLGGPWGPALQQEAALGRGEGARPAARHPVTEPVGQGNMQRHISLFDAQSGFPIIFSPCAGTSDSDSDERSSTATTQSAPILASLLAPSPKEEDYLSHPFARLPVVRGRRGPYYVDFEGALFAENVTQNPLPLLRLVHGLLSQQEIAGEQLEFLATLGSKLAAHATKFHRLGLRYATPSRACERLGTRFLVLDAVVSTAIVLEQKVSLQLWRRFVSTISHEYPKPPASMTNRGRRFFLANFAVLLSNAVKTLKMGFRPSAEELVLLKRMLFCAPYSPPRYKAEGYDAWRFSELVHQGSTGTPSARTAEASSAKFSEASRDVASKPYPGTSARLIRSARAKAPSRTRRETSGSFAGSPAGSPAESSKPAAASAQHPPEANIGFLYQVPAPTHSGPYRGPFSGVFPGTSDGMSLESRSGSAFHTVRRRREGAEEPHRIPLSGPSARNESHSPRPVSSIEHFPGPSASGSYLPPLASAETSAEISGLPVSGGAFALPFPFAAPFAGLPSGASSGPSVGRPPEASPGLFALPVVGGHVGGHFPVHQPTGPFTGPPAARLTERTFGSAVGAPVFYAQAPMDPYVRPVAVPVGLPIGGQLSGHEALGSTHTRVSVETHGSSDDGASGSTETARLLTEGSTHSDFDTSSGMSGGGFAGASKSPASDE